MPTKDAAFYSCRAGRPETLKSHRQLDAAMKAAGEWGQVWITAEGRQRQIHESSAGGWMMVKPQEGVAIEMKPLLLSEGLIVSSNDPG